MLWKHQLISSGQLWCSEALTYQRYILWWRGSCKKRKNRTVLVNLFLRQKSSGLHLFFFFFLTVTMCHAQGTFLWQVKKTKRQNQSLGFLPFMRPDKACTVLCGNPTLKNRTRTNLISHYESYTFRELGTMEGSRKKKCACPWWTFSQWQEECLRRYDTVRNLTKPRWDEIRSTLNQEVSLFNAASLVTPFTPARVCTCVCVCVWKCVHRQRYAYVTR